MESWKQIYNHYINRTFYISFQNYSHHGITEWFTLEGASWDNLILTPEQVPCRFWVPPEKETTQPLWAACSSALSPWTIFWRTNSNFILCIKTIISEQWTNVAKFKLDLPQFSWKIIKTCCRKYGLKKPFPFNRYYFGGNEPQVSRLSTQ